MTFRYLVKTQITLSYLVKTLFDKNKHEQDVLCKTLNLLNVLIMFRPSTRAATKQKFVLISFHVSGPKLVARGCLVRKG